MPSTPSLASASSTPLPSSSAIPASLIAAMTDQVVAMTDQVVAMRDLLDSYTLVESLLNLSADPPPAASVAGLMRVVNAELVQRLAAVEALMPLV